MKLLSSIPVDVWKRHVLAHLTGLELLRFNTINKYFQDLSSSSYLPQWVGYLQLSDKRTYPRSKFQAKTYPSNIGRKQAISRLKTRCMYCRVRTKYVDEFALKRHDFKIRLCENCEQEKRNVLYLTLTGAHLQKQGISHQLMASLPSIDRGTGKDTVQLFLKSDVDSVLNHGKRQEVEESSSSEDWEEENELERKKVQVWRKSRQRQRKQPTAQIAISRPRHHHHRHRQKWSSTASGSRSRKKRQQQWSSSTTALQNEYDMAVSGFSVLCLAD